MASTVFSETLQTITTTKLTELSKKRALFEQQKSTLLSTAVAEADQKKRLRTLIDGVNQIFFEYSPSAVKRGRHVISPVTVETHHPGIGELLKNLTRFHNQALYDPSISPKLMQNWEDSLTKRLTVQSLKYQYASLYGELVTEWLNAEKSSNEVDVAENLEGFEKVNRAEKDAARNEWEHLVFEPLETDPMAISEYLRNLFGENEGNAQGRKALADLRKSVEIFETSLSYSDQFTNNVLKWTINGLLSSGLLSDEKSGALKDFLASPVVLAEIADVLNMRIASIDTWSWEDMVPVEQRMHVTGKYHIYLDEELLQAIFLQYIGIKWAVFFKQAFTGFSKYDGAWASPRTPVSQTERKRREYFLGPQQLKPSVQAKRQGLFRSIFFMSQLPNTPEEGEMDAEGEEEADYDTRSAKRTRSGATASQSFPQQQNNHAMSYPAPMMQQQQQMQVAQAPGRGVRTKQTARRTTGMAMPNVVASYYNPQPMGFPADSDEYDIESDENKPKSPMPIKQFLLHLLTTELIVNTRLDGDFTCSRSEFDSWSPSLPHSTISSVLSFFGLSEKWLKFYRKFLEAPLKFVEDGPSAPTRARKRGVPGAHALSTVCGEVILFCLDYAVNQQTNGVQLYRMHDDFWLWSPSHQTVVKGWAAINRFTEVMGVKLNEGKTGTVRIVKDQKEPAPIDPSIPIGDIRWGFLYMDPVTGRFLIDQEMVDKHIIELQRQLQDKDKSVFSWVQAWNTYAGTFFKSNFGKPANCFGREHVDMMLSTMNRIQKCIFSDSNVVDYLKSTIEKRFGISDIPDGYLYFPTALGGLELQNPFIGLVQVKNSVSENPQDLLDDFLREEQEAYRKAKIAFDSGIVYHPDPHFHPEDGNRFFSFEEFTRHREEFCSLHTDNLYSVFCELLRQPEAVSVDLTTEDEMFLDAYDSDLNDGDDYMRWVAMLYGPDMKERFGGLKIVEKGLLPMGMVTLFRSGRVKWQG